VTDVAVREDTANLPAQPGQPTVEIHSTALLQWAHEAREAAKIAMSLAKTSFVPASLRGKPEDITAAILAGQELGLKPMASLRSMDIIQGTPALRAHAMRGLVQSHGHQVQLVSSDEVRCVMRGRRAGEEEWQEVTWTIGRANQLGLTGKDQWKKQPQTMLIARATGEICRLIASDVLHAMPYAVEELGGDPVRAEASYPAPIEQPRVTLAELTGEPVSGPPAADRGDDEWPATAQPGGGE
jgi:hypothetical protein